MVRKILILALLVSTVLGLMALPAMAGGDDDHKNCPEDHMNHDKNCPKDHKNHDEKCPPGLAKKCPPCVPPGLAKKDP